MSDEPKGVNFMRILKRRIINIWWTQRHIISFTRMLLYSFIGMNCVECTQKCYTYLWISESKLKTKIIWSLGREIVIKKNIHIFSIYFKSNQKDIINIFYLSPDLREIYISENRDTKEKIQSPLYQTYLYAKIQFCNIS